MPFFKSEVWFIIVHVMAQQMQQKQSRGVSSYEIAGSSKHDEPFAATARTRHSTTMQAGNSPVLLNQAYKTLNNKACNLVLNQAYQALTDNQACMQQPS